MALYSRLLSRRNEKDLCISLSLCYRKTIIQKQYNLTLVRLVKFVVEFLTKNNWEIWMVIFIWLAPWLARLTVEILRFWWRLIFWPVDGWEDNLFGIYIPQVICVFSVHGPAFGWVCIPRKYKWRVHLISNKREWNKIYFFNWLINWGVGSN